MATNTFDMKDLQAAGYTPERLVNLAPQMGVEIEKIDETEMTINISPNRPDLLDYIGLVRAFDNFTGKRVPAENYYRLKGSEPMLTITVEKPVSKIRPYIAGLVVKNLNLRGNMLKYYINFTDKFADTYGRKRKKLAIGLHSLQMITGGLVYTASENESFIPLSYDRSMTFNDAMSAHGKGIAYHDAVPGYGTKGVRYPYLKDSEKIIALIPITNAESTRVAEDTKDIFVDITGTSKNAVSSAANLLACSFIDAGADVYAVAIEYPNGADISPQLEYETQKLSLKRAEFTLGASLGKHNVISLANKMGFVAAKFGNAVMFYIPPYRLDVISERDIIEDVAIAFGYNNIVPLPIASVGAGLANDLVEQGNRLAVLMVGLGYLEAVNTMLTNERVNFENMSCKYDKSGYVGIADAKTVNISMLRTDLLPGLLQNLADSMSERLPQRLFEIGSAFNLPGDNLAESVRLAFVSEHPKTNFAEAKSIVEAIMRYRSMEGYRIEAHKNPAYIEGRCAAVRYNNEIICVFGELHPNTLNSFGVEEPVVAGELTIVKEMKYQA